MLKLDLHVHSQYSEDGVGKPKEIIKVLRRNGFQGMALTDHNTLSGVEMALKETSNEFLVIPGVEISSKEGHILGLNVTKEIPRGLSVVETIEKIRDAGGVPLVPHVSRNLSGIKNHNLSRIRARISAIEVFNACSLPQTNLATVRLAESLDLGGTGGSDAHEPAFAGYGYTVVDTTELTVDAVLGEIEKKHTWGEGTTIPLHIRQQRMVKSIAQFFQRGLKRI